MIRQSRQIWRRAHPVKLPSRDTSVHVELADARARENLKRSQLSDELVQALSFVLSEAGFLREE